MGPTLICDKSTLQALNKDELSVLRKYYSLNLPPILLMEILGDLKKHPNAEDGRKEVEMLANKILPACSTVNVDFRFMIRGELAGHKVQMTGVPVLRGARQIADPDGKLGLIFEEPKEHKALLRWQIRDLDGAEVLLAEAWKLSSQSIDLEGMQKKLKNSYSGTINLRNLAETGSFVDGLLRTAPPYQLLLWFFGDASIVLHGNEPQRLEALRDAPPGSINAILPYTSYCLRAALIFHFGLAFALVSTRATNRLDLEYFYYAPFCHLFSSGDKFHRKMASLINNEKVFVEGSALKADLANLAKHRMMMESQGNADGSRNSVPPSNEASITYQAWKDTMKPGFDKVAKDISSHLTPEISAKILKKYRQMMNNRHHSQAPSVSMEDCEFIIMEHSVRPDGPCICGSLKKFKDCCGQKLIAAKQQKTKE